MPRHHESADRQWHELNEAGEIVPVDPSAPPQPKKLARPVRSTAEDDSSQAMDDDYDVYRPAEQEEAAGGLDPKLRGQKIDNERGVDQLNDEARRMLG